MSESGESGGRTVAWVEGGYLFTIQKTMLNFENCRTQYCLGDCSGLGFSQRQREAVLEYAERNQLAVMLKTTGTSGTKNNLLVGKVLG